MSMTRRHESSEQAMILRLPRKSISIRPRDEEGKGIHWTKDEIAPKLFIYLGTTYFHAFMGTLSPCTGILAIRMFF